MSRRELNEAKAEITELRRFLARMFPSGDRRSPHRFWEAVRRLSVYVRELEELSTPLGGRPVASSTVINVDLEASSGAGTGGPSAEQPLFPGIRLIDREGDRNLYHQGREYQQELDRIYSQIERIIGQSATWLRGLDLDPEDIPTHRRPRCPICSEILATTWRFCPYCSTPL